MKLIIDRSRWNRGHCLSGVSHLLGLASDDRCCLGFLGQACGISDEDLQGVAYPSSIRSELWPEKLFERSGWNIVPGSCELYETFFAMLNDERETDEGTRESWIRAGFSILMGIDVEFVDG